MEEKFVKEPLPENAGFITVNYDSKTGTYNL